MARGKEHTPEQVVNLRRQIEVALATRHPTTVAVRRARSRSRLIPVAERVRRHGGFHGPELRGVVAGENLVQRKIRILEFVAVGLPPERDRGDFVLRPGALRLFPFQRYRKHESTSGAMQVERRGAAVYKFQLFFNPGAFRIHRKSVAYFHAAFRTPSE